MGAKEGARIRWATFFGTQKFMPLSTKTLSNPFADFEQSVRFGGLQKLDAIYYVRNVADPDCRLLFTSESNRVWFSFTSMMAEKTNMVLVAKTGGNRFVSLFDPTLNMISFKGLFINAPLDFWFAHRKPMTTPLAAKMLVDYRG